MQDEGLYSHSICNSSDCQDFPFLIALVLSAWVASFSFAKIDFNNNNNNHNFTECEIYKQKDHDKAFVSLRSCQSA